MFFFYPDPIIKFKSPAIFHRIGSAQLNRKCAKMELRVVDCLDTYGLYNGKYECRDLIEDFHECLFSDKRYRRGYLIRQERMRQIQAGEKEYVPTPPYDQYAL